MSYKLRRKSTISGNTFEPVKNYGQRVELASVTQVDLYQGLTVTSIGVSATAFDIKQRDIINIAGQIFALSADEAAGSTSLAVASTVLDFDIDLNSTIEIDVQNLFVQYQRKTEGKIGGMDVSTDSIGPIQFVVVEDTYYITGVDPVYVKILPRDFMINDDGSDEALNFKDSATNTGVQVGNAAQEMIATVNIPYGTTATHVTIWGSQTTRVVEVYEAEVDTNGIGSAIGTGTTNGSAIDITGTAATSTNYLLIKVIVTATTNRIYGGKVTLTQN